MNYQKKQITLGDEIYPMLKVFRSDAKDVLCRHTAVEVSYIISGSGTCVTKNATHRYEKDDILMFSSGEHHSFICDTKTEILTLHTEPRIIWTLGADFPDSPLLQIFFDKNDKFCNLIKSSHPVCSVIKNILLETETEYNEKGRDYVLSCKINAIRIFLILHKNFDYVKRISHNSSRSYNLESLERTMDFIHKCPEQITELEVLSEKAQLSRSHFCTVFKRYNGIPLWDYITIRRVEHALRLIEKTDKTKLEIALECGFNNTANFYRAFKLITGKTPSDIKAE